eukprot:scaffold6735_cov124-Isochrysis_galbana.AAC.5
MVRPAQCWKSVLLRSNCKLVEEGKGCVGQVIDKGTLAINGGGAGGVGTTAILVLFDTGVCEAAVLAFGEAGGGEKFGRRWPRLCHRQTLLVRYETACAVSENGVTNR